MNRLLLPLILSIVFPALICKADMASFNNIPNAQISTGILKSQDLKNTQQADLGKIVVKPSNRQLTRIKSEDLDAADLGSGVLAADNKPIQRKYDGFLSSVSPEYTVKKGFLYLTKVPASRHKRSFMFVFLMNPEKLDPKKAKTINGSSHKRMHVMWTGSKKVVDEQRLVEDQYPIDVSIAHYSDGYSSEGWNLVLPNKKPRELLISLMWSF